MPLKIGSAPFPAISSYLASQTSASRRKPWSGVWGMRGWIFLKELSLGPALLYGLEKPPEIGFGIVSL